MRRRRSGHGHDRRAPQLTRIEVDEQALREARAFNAELERQLAAAPSPHLEPPEATRRLRRTGGGIWGELVFADGAEELAIPTRSDAVRGRVLRPGGREPVGLYLHFHGGGWTFGGCDEQDPRLAALAETTGLAALSVEYRLAPEHPHPAAADDCEDAALWLLERGLSELGVPMRLAIGGESAGAHLSVLTLLRLRDGRGVTGAFAAANLVYGCFDLSQTPSVRGWGDRNLVLSKPIMDWFGELLLPGVTLEERRDPSVSPLYADLASMPPALFSVGDRDPLLDDSLFMHARWLAAGNEAELQVWPEGSHAFNAFPLELSRRSLAAQYDFLSRVAAAPPASG